MLSQQIIPENISLELSSLNPPPQNTFSTSLFEDPLLALSHSLTNFVEFSTAYGTSFLTHHQLLQETSSLYHPLPSTSETIYSMIPLNDLNSPTLTTTPSSTITSSASTAIGLLPSIASLELNNNYIPNNIDLGNHAICEFCGIPISAKTLLVVEGKNFHEACLRCYECGIQLDEKCYYRDGAMLCKNDYLQKYTQQCCRCLTSIKPHELIMNVKETTYFHLNCFTCNECGEMLKQGENFLMDINGALTCYKHIDSKTLETELSPAVVAQEKNVKNAQSKKARLLTASSKSESHVTVSEDEDRESTPDTNSKDKMGKRMRTSFKHHQLREMKRYFQLNHNPDAKDLKGLAQKTGLTKRVLQVWFQNARAKYRRSQANNPNFSGSPNGCILTPIKFEQCYPNPAASSSISDDGGSPRTSASPFECNGTSSSFSRSISPEFDNQSSSATSKV